MIAWKLSQNTKRLVNFVFEAYQAPVVRKADNAIHRINHYPAGSVVSFAKTYPLDSYLSSG